MDTALVANCGQRKFRPLIKVDKYCSSRLNTHAKNCCGGKDIEDLDGKLQVIASGKDSVKLGIRESKNSIALTDKLNIEVDESSWQALAQFASLLRQYKNLSELTVVFKPSSYSETIGVKLLMRSIGQLPDLKKLKLDFNRCNLDLDKDAIGCIASNLAKLKNLECLKLSFTDNGIPQSAMINFVKQIVASITNLLKLQVLIFNLNFNNFWSKVINIDLLAGLKRLGQLKLLKRLDLTLGGFPPKLQRSKSDTLDKKSTAFIQGILRALPPHKITIDLNLVNWLIVKLENCETQVKQELKKFEVEGWNCIFELNNTNRDKINVNLRISNY